MRLIINGDDFGLCASVNDSVATLIERGAMTSASVLVGRDRASFRDAVRSSHDLADRAGFGLHLDLDHLFRFDETAHFGIDENDIVPGYREIVRHRRRAIRDDAIAQMRLLQDAGVPVSHLDGHHMVHLFPGIVEIVIEAMVECGLERMRFSRAFYRDGVNLERSLGLIARGGIRVPDECIDLVDIMRGKTLPPDDDRIVEIMAHTDATDNAFGRVDQHRFLLEKGFPGHALISFAGL